MLTIGMINVDNVREELVGRWGEYPYMLSNVLLDAAQTYGLGTLKTITYHAHFGELPSMSDEVDAFIILGSKYSVYDDIEWIKHLSAWVVEAHQQRQKLIGICFGHQLVAHSLGGKVTRNDKGWSIGIKTCEMTDEQWFLSGSDHSSSGKSGSNNNGLKNKTNAVDLFYSHQDHVVEVAPGSIVKATTRHCPNAMVMLGDHILTFQGHPEFSKGYAQALIQLRRSQFDVENYQQCLDSLELNHSDNLGVARLMLDFIRR